MSHYIRQKRTFIGYYKISAAGVVPIIIRPQVTIPRTSAIKGSGVVENISAIADDITAIVDSNELVPVTTVDPNFNSELIQYFEGVVQLATTNNATISSVLYLEEAKDGEFAGQCVFVLNTSQRNVIRIKEFLPADTDELVPGIIDSADWMITPGASGAYTVLLDGTPEDNGSALTSVTVGFFDGEALVHSDTYDATAIGTGELTGTVASEDMTEGEPYQARLVFFNANGNGGPSAGKPFVPTFLA